MLELTKALNLVSMVVVFLVLKAAGYSDFAPFALVALELALAEDNYIDQECCAYLAVAVAFGDKSAAGFVVGLAGLAFVAAAVVVDIGQIAAEHCFGKKGFAVVAEPRYYRKKLVVPPLDFGKHKHSPVLAVACTDLTES